jgi:hypothetical protein
MFDFLERVYNRTRSDSLGALLGSMSTTTDGRPADPAVWTEWEESVTRARDGEVETGLELS